MLASSDRAWQAAFPPLQSCETRPLKLGFQRVVSNRQRNAAQHRGRGLLCQHEETNTIEARR